jgi:transcriptional regulator with XRE-family HTH domain
VSALTSLKITKSQIEKLSENLKMLLRERHVTENDIAQALEIPVMTVRRIVSGETTDPRISTLKLLADFFNVGIDSLLDENRNSITLTSNNIPQFIPILDWKITESVSSIKEVDLKAWKEWLPVVTRERLSEDAFALESRPSMHPRFPFGTLFIIDPNEAPTDGDLVLIKIRADGHLSLRELAIDPPKWQLQALVIGSETIFFEESKHSIVGIVVLSMLHARKNKSGA